MHKARVLANVYFWNKYYLLNNIDKIYKLNLPFENQSIINKEEYNMLLQLQRRD